jgi:transcriptional regulator with XRE-family HTH domain
MTAPAEVIAHLHRRRRELRVRQADLARRIGVSKSALGRWERRTTDPGIGNHCAWCEELHLDIQLVPRRIVTPA